VTLARDAIARLVPHQGAMCLLEEVLEWDENAIVCRACSHRDPANPLRSRGGLSAIIGVEYAAQAVAVHGSLNNNSAKPRGGFLAALRDVACFTDRLDTEPGDLTVRATKVAAEGGRLLYDFRIEGGGRELLKGRLSVVVSR
jgi:predicted hotdog family 3-hydroxylacyl-ACP dehydratase